MRLEPIDKSHETDITSFIKTMKEHESEIHGLWFSNAPDFDSMLTSLEMHRLIKHESYDQGIPQMHQFVIKKDNTCLGVVSIRPFLTKGLDDSFGGHIGYSIDPRYRNQGFGTLALRLALETMQSLGSHEEPIVCCEKTNHASRAIILKCGGELIEDNGQDEKYRIK